MLFIFDMGGVFTNTFMMDSLYNKLNISKEKFNDICRMENTDIWQLLQTGKIDSEKFWQSFSLRSGSKIDTDLFRLFFHPSKNLETLALVEELKKKHRVVCGTNTIQSHWENHMERGDYSYFNQTYASNKIGFAKPDPRFFELILEAENTAPENAFFTDDRAENVKAAQSVGINAVQFTSAKALRDLWSRYC